MQKIARDVRDDIRAAKKIRVTWWGMLAVSAGTLLTAWIVSSMGRLELTLPIVNAVLVLAFVIAVKPNLRGKPWFWTFMGLVAALHIILLVTIPWTTKWVPAFAIAFIDSIDLFGILAALSVISNAMENLKQV
jgi:hypothetical protein